MLILDKALFLKFDQETTINPPESSWWGEYDNQGNVLHRNETDGYKYDLIGIRTLEEQGRAIFATLPGRHVQITTEDVDNVVIPFILNQL